MVNYPVDKLKELNFYPIKGKTTESTEKISAFKKKDFWTFF